jgi:hypothetical protein
VSTEEGHEAEEMANGGVASRTNARDMRRALKTLNDG